MALGKTPLAVEQKLLKVVPAEYRLHAHHWLILHGRYVCTARKPRCTECQIADLCDYARASRQRGEGPAGGARSSGGGDR
jgi:endonuclease-3